MNLYEILKDVPVDELPNYLMVLADRVEEEGDIELSAVMRNMSSFDRSYLENGLLCLVQDTANDWLMRVFVCFGNPKLYPVFGDVVFNYDSEHSHDYTIYSGEDSIDGNSRQDVALRCQALAFCRTEQGAEHARQYRMCQEFRCEEPSEFEDTQEETEWDDNFGAEMEY